MGAGNGNELGQGQGSFYAVGGRTGGGVGVGLGKDAISDRLKRIIRMARKEVAMEMEREAEGEDDLIGIGLGGDLERLNEVEGDDYPVGAAGMRKRAGGGDDLVLDEGRAVKRRRTEHRPVTGDDSAHALINDDSQSATLADPVPISNTHTKRGSSAQTPGVEVARIPQWDDDDPTLSTQIPYQLQFIARARSIGAKAAETNSGPGREENIESSEVTAAAAGRMMQDLLQSAALGNLPVEEEAVVAGVAAAAHAVANGDDSIGPSSSTNDAFPAFAITETLRNIQAQQAEAQAQADAAVPASSGIDGHVTLNSQAIAFNGLGNAISDEQWEALQRSSGNSDLAEAGEADGVKMVTVVLDSGMCQNCGRAATTVWRTLNVQGVKYKVCNRECTLLQLFRAPRSRSLLCRADTHLHHLP